MICLRLETTLPAIDSNIIDYDDVRFQSFQPVSLSPWTCNYPWTIHQPPTLTATDAPRRLQTARRLPNSTMWPLVNLHTVAWTRRLVAHDADRILRDAKRIARLKVETVSYLKHCLTTV